VDHNATQELVTGEMRLRDRHVVMWNLEDDDATDVRNFIPAYLVKVANDVFEVMDDKDDVCFATLSRDILSEMWGNEVRFPCSEFVQHCKDNCLFFDGSNQRIDGLGHEVSPIRQELREEAAKNMDRSSRKVMKRIKSRSAVVSIGDVVQVPLVQQDRSKVDAGNLTGVVVNINNTFGICQVAVKTGVLRPWYVYHKLRVVTGAGNNRVLMDLETAFQGWRTMKIIAPRTAAINESIVGGQGIFSCKCKGKCISNICLCFKNNKCNPFCVFQKVIHSYFTFYKKKLLFVFSKK
jgi:hypothetical protein